MRLIVEEYNLHRDTPGGGHQNSVWQAFSSVSSQQSDVTAGSPLFWGMRGGVQALQYSAGGGFDFDIWHRKSSVTVRSELLALRTQRFIEALVTSDVLAGRKHPFPEKPFVSCSSFCAKPRIYLVTTGTSNLSLT